MAALYPEEHEYTHYVLDSSLNGTHRFTADDEEYEAWLEEYEKAVKEAAEEAEASEETEENKETEEAAESEGGSE